MNKKYRDSEAGNFSIILSITALAILIAIGAAVDISVLQSEKRKMQDATDSAVLAAAFAMTNEVSLNETERQAKAVNIGLEAFASNQQSLRLSNETVEIRIGNEEIVASSEANTVLTFGKLLGMETAKIAARSVSTYQLNSVPPCVIALSETANPGLLVNMRAVVTAPGCEAHVHSTASPALTINRGSVLSFNKTCVAGRSILNNGSSSNIQTNCTVAADPYDGKIPVVSDLSCDYNNSTYHTSSITLSPGTYCGFHNFQNRHANVTFEPGLYVLKDGGWVVDGGQWSGEGVTFYFADSTSQIQFNSAVSADLRAPTSGPYAGIFMTESPLSEKLPYTKQFVLNDSRGFIFEGAIYLPNKEFVMNSGSDTQSRNLNIVADTIIFNSTSLTLENSSASGQNSNIRLVD